MNGTNYEVPHCGAFSTPHFHPSWAQIFASGSCFQIPLAWIPLSYTIRNNIHLLRNSWSLNMGVCYSIANCLLVYYLDTFTCYFGALSIRFSLSISERGISKPRLSTTQSWNRIYIIQLSRINTGFLQWTPLRYHTSPQFMSYACHWTRILN